MINFVEDTCTNYQHRTFMNIELSDLTLIFVRDISTAGNLYKYLQRNLSYILFYKYTQIFFIFKSMGIKKKDFEKSLFML